jgi:hypothetical protein
MPLRLNGHQRLANVELWPDITHEWKLWTSKILGRQIAQIWILFQRIPIISIRQFSSSARRHHPRFISQLADLLIVLGNVVGEQMVSEARFVKNADSINVLLLECWQDWQLQGNDSSMIGFPGSNQKVAQ